METVDDAHSAASILVLRDGKHGLEVLMLRRHANSPSAPRALVFPGGMTDAADLVVENRVTVGILDDDLARTWGFGAAGVAVAVALRELFEEAGLLCTTRPTTPEQRETWRELAQATPANFYEILSSNERQLDAAGLVYMAHWRTPEGRPRRYDTRFFAARCPEGQEARCDGHETTEEFWTTPARALENFHRGEWSMLLPTRTLLAQLATFSSIDDAFDFWRRTPVTMVQPVDVVVNGERVALLPDNG